VTSRLQHARNLFVRRWGEMGGYWGISRTMAEIHALLFVSRRPLCTDDVMDQLKISRGNASMNLRALVDWGLIDRVHQLGDRKEYFRADTDVWHMFETIMRQRRRREVEPVFATLDRCCEMVRPPQPAPAGEDPQEAAEFLQRLNDLRRFLTSMGRLFELVLQVGPQGLEGLAAAITPLPNARLRRPRTRAAGRT
jgi:DNA-binding transcriptional regulator GbsR (MarR family)